MFGGSDEETGLEIKKCAFSAGFLKEACLSAWEKVGAAPCTRKCLSDPKVSRSLGDGDDEYYNSIQVANDHAVHALNKMGYAGYMLAVQIEDDREEAVPLTAHSAAIERANRGHAESNDPHENVPHDQRGACHDR